MHIPAIKHLVENASFSDLKAAEALLMEGKDPELEVEGADTGEKLTHVLGAIEILQAMQEGEEYHDAIRAYARRVREFLH